MKIAIHHLFRSKNGVNPSNNLVTLNTQKFMEIVGPGGTGKSTLVRLIQEFIGKENHVTTDLKNLEGNQFETAMLYGKRVAFINDSSRYGGDVNVLKAITGGDPVRMEKKRVQQGKSFRAESFIYIVSNEAIQSTDYTSGLSRRRVPVNFMRQVSDADKDKWEKVGGIEKAMRAELPGLLNWVISMGKDDALAALGGINGRQSLTSRQHQIDTNPLAAWTEERCVLVPGSKTYTGGKPRKGAEPGEIDWGIAHKLFPNYHNWCHVNSSPHSLSVQNFGKHLEDLLKRTLQLTVDRLPKDKNGRAFSGIVLRTKEHSSIPTPILGETLK